MLEISNVSKVFNPGTADERRVFDSLSLSVQSGEFVTIIGSNGAGKSTLFNLICGTFLPDGGRILLDGEDITYKPDFRRAKKIGRLFQDPMKGTAPAMTIEENLSLSSGHGGWFSSISAKEKRIFRERLAALGMGLEDRTKQPVGLLSGGQRQALTLLMATFNPPKLLLLDEHTAALDPASAEKILDMTKKIVSENKLTCLMITHNMSQALELGNRTLMMQNGQILLDISGKERAGMSVDDLLLKFKESAGQRLDNDRILLS